MASPGVSVLGKAIRQRRFYAEGVLCVDVACVVAALLLAGCGTADTKLSEDQARAEQVVRDYFLSPGMETSKCKDSFLLARTVPSAQDISSMTHGAAREYWFSVPSFLDVTRPASFSIERCLEATDLPIPASTANSQTHHGFSRSLSSRKMRIGLASARNICAVNSQCILWCRSISKLSPDRETMSSPSPARNQRWADNIGRTNSCARASQ